MPDRSKYIPAGCLRLGYGATDLLDQSSLPDSSNTWVSFDLPGEPGAPPGRSRLSPDFQDKLLRCNALAPFSQLFKRQWIQLEFCSKWGDLVGGVCRVYILPDDMERRAVPRSDPRRRKDLQALLVQLDHSKELWADGTGAGSDTESDDSGTLSEEDSDSGGMEPEPRGPDSLLQMFNTIPSPDPQLDAAPGSNYFRIFNSILASKIPGLNTQLFAYQSRSAALMLQREYQPGTVLDPRLVKAADHEGGTWYYDNVTGEVVREPRRYEGIRGGILAEEMGAGKTLICLALILATKNFPAETPEFYKGTGHSTRPRVGSLVDMAAATVTRESVPWIPYFRPSEGSCVEYANCVEAIRRNPGYYLLQQAGPRRQSRRPVADDVPTKIYLSSCSLVIVPMNLAKQWVQEIKKHTNGLKVLPLTGKATVPPALELAEYDIVLCSVTWFERLKQGARMARTGWALDSPLAQIQFKRVIVDEGHRLGNCRMHKKSDMLLMLECLQVSSRWIVTGTPSTGMFGVDASEPTTPVSETGSDVAEWPSGTPNKKRSAESSGAQERSDLERIGAMAALFLKARPWANTANDGDTPADWKIYVMQPKHSSRSQGRKEVLRSTLDTLIIRHRRSDIGDLLPMVSEKVVLLDGCFQDKLSLNLFAMMIIFNAVQSERKDQDYLFHPKQRSALLLLVSNMRQSSFYGGYFFPDAEIRKAIETAERFLEDGKVSVTEEDKMLLKNAIAFGYYALGNNHLRTVSDNYHEVPIYVEDFPGGDSCCRMWSLDGGESSLVCTAAPMMLAMQQVLKGCVDAPHSLQVMLNSGRFAMEGRETRFAVKERREAQVETIAGKKTEKTKKMPNLAGNAITGNTVTGESVSPTKRRTASHGTPARMNELLGRHDIPEKDIAEPLAKARIVSTASAKLSYLIDSIIKHQDDEQIIVFYENDNVAFYIAEHLEVLLIGHLIYAKGITAELRAQYVDIFNHNPKCRVLLMDISQAAFGLNLQAASRIYFTNPVLNPQVEAQAIGRVRRISQKRQVSVETLVLRGSVEEVIVERRRHMTQAEHRKMKSILDDRPIYDWILNAGVQPMPSGVHKAIDQTAWLTKPQFLFGRGFGRRAEHQDEGHVVGGIPEKTPGGELTKLPDGAGSADGPSVRRRVVGVSFAGLSDAGPVSDGVKRPKAGVKFAGVFVADTAAPGAKRPLGGPDGGPAGDVTPKPKRPRLGVGFSDAPGDIPVVDSASDAILDRRLGGGPYDNETPSADGESSVPIAGSWLPGQTNGYYSGLVDGLRSTNIG